ncbi:MAG: VWA domain-containing protein [Lentimonas sp.]
MSEFVFQWPSILALLFATIPLVWILAYARKQRLLLIEAMGGGHPTHRKLRDMLRVVAFILLVLALARPGYAPHTEATSRSGRDVVFAIDVSQSMLAEDATPSRLEVAKQAVRDALHTFGNERVGLVVYAGSASILCPLTYDYDFVRYMLEQANTRTVDFGGTTLQSAVEKAVDQVFIEGRQDVQDLVVMTDGGDHGSIIDKTIELLNENGVDTLLIGLGNPNQGAPIKFKDEEGNTKLLEYEGSPVYTKLDDAALREFAVQSGRIDYLPIGTSPFNLGQVYIDYAQDKKIDSADSENGIIIYQEAAMFFLIPAVILLILSERWGARGLQLGQAAIIIGVFIGFTPDATAGERLIGLTPDATTGGSFQTNFEHAYATLKAGTFEEAQALFVELHHSASANTASPQQLAAIQFNRGLALIGQSNAQETPQLALSYAQQAQLAFLVAKRGAPDLKRAGVRLQITATAMAALQAKIDEMEALNDQINQEMEALIARLQALLEAQTELRKAVAEQAVKPDAAKQAESFIQRQNEHHQEALALQLVMKNLDTMMQVPVESMPTEESLKAEPMHLIALAQISQEAAADQLKQLEQWPLAQELQLDVEHRIEQILELLANDSQNDPSESEDWDEMEEDYDYMDESEESMSSSESMEGDFAASSEMQDLPLPNYSAEDILMEEQGSQQFRQQKRASANAAKVEKDF